MSMEREFGCWQRFADVAPAEITKEKGIYAFAISADALSNKPFAVIEPIVYFGMTNAAGGLRSRLKQFRDTLFSGKRLHGGAERFFFEHKDKLADLQRTLYFSVCPFASAPNQPSIAELRLMGDVAKAEYEAFADYFGAYGHLPKFNDKKASPKK